MSEMHQKLIDGKVELRPMPDGSFDELVMYGEDGKCIVHAEMMDGNRLWIGFYPPGEKERRVVMNIGASGDLAITAEED